MDKKLLATVDMIAREKFGVFPIPIPKEYRPQTYTAALRRLLPKGHARLNIVGRVVFVTIKEKK